MSSAPKDLSLVCLTVHPFPSPLCHSDYNIALRIELARREVKDDAARTAELAAYFTHCNLQRVHLALSLRSAMSTFFKLKNFATCATFCRRLLELQPDEKVSQPSGSGGSSRAHSGEGGCRCWKTALTHFPPWSRSLSPVLQMAQQARQVLAACEKTPTDAEQLNYDPRNPFDICSLTFTPIYRGNKVSCRNAWCSSPRCHLPVCCHDCTSNPCLYPCAAALCRSLWRILTPRRASSPSAPARSAPWATSRASASTPAA